MGREEQIVEERLRKIEELRKKGINPYAHKYEKKQTIAETLKSKLGSKIKTAGRLMTKRDLGKIAFCKLQDGTGTIQIVFQEKQTPDKAIKLFKDYADSGDFIGVEGKLFKTKTKETSILVKDIEILTKSVLPLPSEWYGLQDKEERYRKRYVDLILNPQVKEVFEKRQKVIDAVREFLIKRKYVEVQTPILQPI